ncbi:MAG: YeeE/YedE family protein, partial [Bacteroidota bacterium]
MLELLKQPWPWYVAGPLIGLVVPFLLIIGNKSFGISSNLRHICAAAIPAKIPFFQYDWKKELWNLFLVFGVFVGGVIAIQFLSTSDPIVVNPELTRELAQYGITNFDNLVPVDIINWQSLLSIKGLLLMVMG